jgi:protein gp37
MDPQWVREIRDRCLRARVPFFFKQWGGVLKSRTGRILDGRTWDEMPGGNAPSVEDFPILETACG